ncbi:MAG TPA: NADH-quinone oxidoreductase subunit M [Candidatus Aminicenantes bacterium]|nr:NADH-quinone oxidoreductase subunit M [Candidatus Aminicenantes bacterium]HRY64156.1 NADH-quinone oxidoreductase subunit M [Candidatus Aminicenantes bacterium]HRZ71069.1 NADH-quinone oxidoreductase subunit M [Candidatus Aminicenantes bacterium]
MIILFIVLPLIVAGLLPIIGKVSRRVLPDALANATLLALLVYAVVAGRGLIADGPVLQQLSWLGEAVNVRLALDGFSLFMLMAVSLVGLAAGLFSIDYMEHYGAKANFYALYLVMIAGMNGLILATDLFSVYVFLEVAAIASYALVAFGLGRDELEAAFKYLMLSVVASAFLVVGIAVIFGLTGQLDFAAVAAGLKEVNAGPVLGLVTAFFLLGFGLKAALVPFHAWLPDAHPSAPAPISAVLSGLLIKVSGVYALTRIFINVFGLTPALSAVLMALGAVSIVVAALLALGQKDMKRMLAYSSISQVGYIVLGLGIGTPLGIAGGLFHLFNHALAKGLLFLTSGSVQQATGTRDMDEMGGLAKRMPVTAVTNLIGSLSIAGVPPLNGFWSKLIIIVALVQAGHPVYAVIAVLASVLTLWYYLLMQRKAFFGKLNEKWAAVKEAPFWMTAAVVLLALLCVGVGILFSSTVTTWIQPAADILADGVHAATGSWGF